MIRQFWWRNVKQNRVIVTSWNLPLSGNQQQVLLFLHLDPSFFSSFHQVVARWLLPDCIEGQYWFCIHLRLGTVMIQSWAEHTKLAPHLNTNIIHLIINIVANQVLSASQLSPWAVDGYLADVGVVASVTYVKEGVACPFNFPRTPMRIQMYKSQNQRCWETRYVP